MRLPGRLRTCLKTPRARAARLELQVAAVLMTGKRARLGRYGGKLLLGCRPRPLTL